MVRRCLEGKKEASVVFLVRRIFLLRKNEGRGFETEGGMNFFSRNQPLMPSHLLVPTIGTPNHRLRIEI